MKLAIAADHNGYELKKYIVKHMKDIEFIDFSSKELIPTDDHPDYAFKLGEYCVKNNVRGILICGSGIGMSIACNKVKGVRCGRVTSMKDVIATRNDNDANVISFAGYLKPERAIRIIETFIETPFSTEERYIRRVNKVSKYEK